jgi:hypothetical protein
MGLRWPGQDETVISGPRPSQPRGKALNRLHRLARGAVELSIFAALAIAFLVAEALDRNIEK